MKNSNKVLSLLISAGILIGAASTLSSCNPSGRVYKIWAWNKNVDAINAGIKSYQEQVDPNFKAKVEPFARLDIDKKFKSASQTNNKANMGDIVLCDGMNMLTYYDLWSDIFTDMTPYITETDKDSLLLAAFEEGFAGDKLLGLPLDAPPNVVFANKTLWNPETLQKVKNEGWTWDEYLEIGKQIKVDKGNDIYMTSYNLRGDDRIYRCMTSQKGEWLMDRDYNVFVGNKLSVNAMTKVKTFKDNGVLGHIDTGDYKSLMKTNKIAAQIQGFFLGGQLKDVAPEMSGDWEVLPLPKWDKEDTSSASITGGSYLYANSNLEGEELTKAVDFIKWLTLNPDTVANSLKDYGVFPALKTAYQTDIFKNTKDPYFNNQTVWKNVAECSLDAKSIVATKYNGFNYDSFIKAQERILFGDNSKTIKEELDISAEEMRNNAK